MFEAVQLLDHWYLKGSLYSCFFFKSVYRCPHSSLVSSAPGGFVCPVLVHWVGIRGNQNLCLSGINIVKQKVIVVSECNGQPCWELYKKFGSLWLQTSRLECMYRETWPISICLKRKYLSVNMYIADHWRNL